MQEKIFYTVLWALVGLGITAGVVILSLVFLPLFIIFCGTGGGCVSVIGRILTGVYYLVVVSTGFYLIVKFGRKGYDFGKKREAKSFQKYGKQPPVGLTVFVICLLLAAVLGPDSILILLPLIPISFVMGLIFNNLPNPLLAMVIALPNVLLIAYLVDLIWKKKNRRPVNSIGINQS